jgi:DHA1 family multidrug resistance protein-like MFS transporter
MLLFASQIVNIGFGLLAIFITLLADEINLSAIEIGIVISIFMVARAISSGVVPAISDRVGRRIILVISLLMYAVSTVLLGFSRDFLSLFLLRIIEGAATGAVFPTAEALLVDSVPSSERGAWMGKYFTTFNLGFVIGPALGGILFTFGLEVLKLDKLTSFMIPFAFTGVLGLLSMISVIIFVQDIIKTQKDPEKTDPEKKVDQLLGVPYFSSFLAIGVLTGFSIGLIIPIFTLHATNAFGLTEGTIGFIFTISGTAALLVNYPAGRLSDRLQNRMSIVVIGIVFAGLGFIIVGFSTSIIFVLLAFIFRSMAYQAYIPAYRAFQADQIPHMIRGKTMGRIQSAFNVGAIFGPLVGSAIYEVVSSDWIRILGINYVFYGGGIPFLVAGVFTISQVIVAIYILRTENAK